MSSPKGCHHIRRGGDPIMSRNRETDEKKSKRPDQETDPIPVQKRSRQPDDKVPDQERNRQSDEEADKIPAMETKYMEMIRNSDRQESKIPLLMKKINLRLKEKADKDMREWGLTISQARALHVIGIHGGSITQKKLELELGVSHPTIVGLVSRMEENGFVHVSVDPGDRRNKIVSFAEKACKHGIAIRYQRFEIDDRLLRGMSEEEKKETERLLNIIYHNIEDWDEYREGIDPGTK